ncbi:Rhomboid-like protein 14 mitochondrial [Bienertia sinuspersici]
MEIGGRRVSRGMLPILALHTASEYYRLERKPPVTFGLLAANTLIYLRPDVIKSVFPSINEVWFNAHLILKHKDLKRFFLSPFYHMDEAHLVYNMLSLLWKGIQLETSMGSIEFSSMVATLLTMSQGITLLLCKSLLFFDYKKSYYYEYAVGFSGILFAMKVVLNAQSDEYTFVHGILVPSRYSAWAELALIQLFVPGVSFIGHLGGILAGILYLNLKRSYSSPNPLRLVIRSLSGVFSWPLRFLRSLFRPRRYSGTGVIGRGNVSGVGVWRCPACTFDNSSLLSVCEMCGTGLDGSSLSSNLQNDLSLDELRRRRVQRFSQ